jgi:hypothetical protein
MRRRRFFDKSIVENAKKTELYGRSGEEAGVWKMGKKTKGTRSLTAVYEIPGSFV